MKILLSDFRYAWRRARRQPMATLSIILLLALGMGGLTAVFNPIYSTLFSPLPFPNPDQLVTIGNPLLFMNQAISTEDEIFSRIFSNTSGYYPEQVQIRIPDTEKHLEGNILNVSENFFETLGVQPLMGYSCGRKESLLGVVVSYRFWRNELVQKPDVIGSYIELSSKKVPTIVGVMPEKFNFPFDTDIWWCGNRNMWGGFSLSMIDSAYLGRLHPGISVGRAAEELLNYSTDRLRVPNSIKVQSLQTFLYRDQRPMLSLLGAAAILFLALVCAGVVNLLIAQGVKRKQEIATRLIYGATRWNLVFQLLRETLPLVVIGGLTGFWLSEMASAWMWAQMPALRGGAVNVPVKIAFWAALVMVVTLIGGLVPSLYATSLDLNTYLKSATSEKRRFLSTREFLVGVQLSLALALLIGVSVLLRSMMFNVDIPIGWSSRDIAVVSVNYSGSSLTADAVPRPVALLNQDMQDELRAMPEVKSVGIISPIPFSSLAVDNSRSYTAVYKDRISSNVPMDQNWSALSIRIGVDANGFDLLGIPIVIGRSFTDADAANPREGGYENGAATIINQVFAERLWPGENPVGKIFYDMKASYEVVGVVRNYHQVPGNKDFIPALYFPFRGTASRQNFLVRLRPGTSFQSFHSNLRRRFSSFPMSWIEAKPLSEYVKEATTNQKLTLQLLIGFAVLGIIVSGLGVYATATLMAAARTKETGIRMALGAQTWDIIKLAFWRGIKAIFIGLPFGLFLAWILAKVLSSFLVQVKIGDTLSWVISCAILLVIATVAALIPALRASRVKPLDALRND